MKLAVTMAQKAPENAPILLRGSFSESIRIAASLGYEAAELFLRSPEEANLPILNDCCLKYGMSISAIGTGGSYVYDRLSLTDPREEVRDQCLARLHEFIELGAALKAAVIIGSARGSIPGTDNYDLYEQYCLDGLCRLAEHAAQKQVTLVLEAINRYETNFLNTADQTLDLIKKTGSQSIKLHLDTFHMNIEETNIAESIIRCGALLGHLHFADSNRHYPGAGHIDFGAVIKALKTIGYEKDIAFECLPEPDPLTAAEHSLSHINTLLEQQALSENY